MLTLARFARKKGSKDKKKRRRRLLRNIALGLGSAGALAGGAYLLSKRPKRTPETDDFFDFINDIDVLGRKAKRRANNPPGYGRVVDDPDWMTVDISKPQKRLQAEKIPTVSSKQKRLNRSDKIRKRMGGDIFVDTRKLAKEKQAASRKMKEIRKESRENMRELGRSGAVYGSPEYEKYMSKDREIDARYNSYKDEVYRPINARLFERNLKLRMANDRLKKQDPANYSFGLNSTNFFQHTLSMTGMKSLNSMIAEFGRGKDLFKRKKKRKLKHYLAKGAFLGGVAGGLAAVVRPSKLRGIARLAQEQRIEAAGILAGAGIGAGVYGVKKLKDGITQSRSKKRSPMSILTRS